MAFVPGQRWISNAEPELGLGTVVRLEGRTVQVLFATAGVLRQYAMHAAPLTRAEFRVGQKVSGQKRSFVIERVSTQDGMLAYHGGGITLPEAELAPLLAAGWPINVVGHAGAGVGVTLVDGQGQDITPATRGYQHFREQP